MASLLMIKTVEARIQAVNDFSPGTAAPVGPSIPCKAANVFSPLWFTYTVSYIREAFAVTQMPNSLFPDSYERVIGCDPHRLIDDLFCCKALHCIDLSSGLF